MLRTPGGGSDSAPQPRLTDLEGLLDRMVGAETDETGTTNPTELERILDSTLEDLREQPAVSLYLSPQRVMRTPRAGPRQRDVESRFHFP